MEDLGISRDGKRPIKLVRLSDWSWVYSSRSPFILFVAADASADDEVEIRRFAAEAVEAGCAYVCTWGDRCKFVHDVFDLASIDADRLVMSTWHSDESLAEALYFALYNAWPDDDQFPNTEDAPVVLAVDEPWLTAVRRLVADQDELVRVVLAQEG
jgi:hypothetical protein